MSILMAVDFAPLSKAASPLVRLVKELYAEHHLLTLVCGFFVVMMTISCYKFLKGINPALVGLVMLLMVGILIMHWTVTRTEPDFMEPFISWLAPFFPNVMDLPPTTPKK